MDPYPRKGGCQQWSRKHHSLLQKAKENDTEKDSRDTPPTPNDEHPNVIQGMKQGKLFGVNHLNPVGPQRAGDPCIKAGEKEGKQLIIKKINAHYLCRQVIIPDSNEGSTHPCSRQILG